MGQRGQTAGGPDSCDRFAGTKAVPRDVRGLAVGQQLSHRHVYRRRVAGRNQKAGNLGATQRGPGLRPERGDALIDGQSKLAQTGDHLRESSRAQPSLALEGGFEALVVRVNSKTQDVKLALPQTTDARGHGVDLHGRHEVERKRRRPHRAELADAGQGVVVGESQHPNSCRSRGIHQDAWLQDSVRSAAVGMKIDPRRVFGHHRMARRCPPGAVAESEGAGVAAGLVSPDASRRS